MVALINRCIDAYMAMDDVWIDFCFLSDIQTKLNNDVHANGQHTDAV